MECKTRVGVLLVHGIGEQRAFEHLESEVQSLACAIRAQVERTGGGQVTVGVCTTRDASYRAERETWRAESEAPVRVSVKDARGFTEIEFQEVWWADLDEPTTFWNALGFWFWGLSMWARGPYEKPRPRPHRRPAKQGPVLDGFVRSMFLPGRDDRRVGRPPRWRALTRLHLFVTGTIFLLTLGTLLLASWLGRSLRMFSIPPADILVRYMADVKLYQQSRRRDLLPLTDMGLPPRVTIRRRMVRAAADMALSQYDRWYIFGHSLGTVVAFNAVMETDHCLPNYLDEERWNRCRARGLGGPARPGDTVGAVDEMMPMRPVWLGDRDVIYRDRLFETFRGLLTYGSPLDKFATLFPAIVPLNKRQAVFAPGCEWINVYDPTDPVGASLDFFDPARAARPEADLSTRTALRPRNYAFRASPFLLYSHVRYMHFKDEAPGRLVDRAAAWILTGGSFPHPKSGDRDWLTRPALIRRLASRAVQTFGVAVVASFLLAALLGRTIREVLDLAGRIGGWDALSGAAYESLVSWVLTAPLIRPVVTWLHTAIGPLSTKAVLYFAAAVLIVFTIGGIRFLLRMASVSRD